MAQLFASKFWVSYHCPRFPIVALKSDLNCACETKTQGAIFIAEQKVTGKHLHAFLSRGWGARRREEKEECFHFHMSTSSWRLQVPASVCPGQPLTFSGPWLPALENSNTASMPQRWQQRKTKVTTANTPGCHKSHSLSELYRSGNIICHLPVSCAMGLRILCKSASGGYEDSCVKVEEGHVLVIYYFHKKFRNQNFEIL